jgi:parvulin-like peptidyl-prolyl isomerase
MIQKLRYSLLTFSLMSLVGLGVYAYSEEPGAVATAGTETQAGEPLDDVIARVGDQIITYNELNTLLNSSAVVGLSVPALGTPERNRVRITLLDKAVSSNLLYLDALKQGLDKDPVYIGDMQHFTDGVLSGLYRQKHLIGDIEVTKAEVQEFFKSSIMPGTEMTDDLRLGIEAAIRKQRFKDRAANMRARLREDVKVTIDAGILASADEDEDRDDTVEVASIDGEPIQWAEVKDLLQAQSKRTAQAEFHLYEDEERAKALDQYIDSVIMAKKARAAGLEQDPVYQRRYKEYAKNHLTNMHRENLYREWEPTDDELWDYFDKNRDKITLAESRKVQMVVLKTQEEAEAVKKRIEAGKISIYEAARDHSIDPNAKQTLGEMGWVSKGTGFAELDKLTFSIEPETLGGPVESPAGWHLVTVLDVRDAMFEDMVDEETWKTTRRRYLQEKMNDYVINLRKNEFPVVVYEDNIDRLFKAEAEWIAALEEKAAQSPEETQKRLDEATKFMKP